MNKRLQIALVYAAKGWPLVPQSRTKVPPFKEWQHKATSDEQTLTGWAKEYPRQNFAVMAGKGSGIVVLDVDCKKGQPGLDSLAKLEEEHGHIDTMRTQTPSGGQHLYFAYPDDVEDISSRDLPDYDGIEVKADGNHLVTLPGSFYENGAEYRLITDGVDPAPVPDWLLFLLLKEAEKTPGLHNTTNETGQEAPTAPPLQDIPDVIPEGERNETLFQIGGKLRAMGYPKQKIRAFLEYVNEYHTGGNPIDVQELQSIITSVCKVKPGTFPARIGKKLPPETAEVIKRAAFQPIDPEFTELIFTILADSNTQQIEKRQFAGRLLLDWLRKHGGFLQTDVGELFYFFRETRRLHRVESNEFAAFLYALTQVNPAGTDFSYLLADCRSEALLNGTKKPVYKVSWWDKDNKILYVSRFDGSVYCLDGDNITEAPNGEAVFFDDSILWQPYTPNLAQQGLFRCELLDELCYAHPNWEHADIHGLAFKVWIISVFLIDLCPTRPLLGLIGEKGSGKSMLFRLFLRYLFGPNGEVSGVPDKPDGFTAGASAAHVFILDNLDTIVDWLRDKLARVATGTIDSTRQLYTSNEQLIIRYRCFVGVTSRNPATLRRDDLTDRLVALPLSRIPDGSQFAERFFLDNADQNRDRWWSEILVYLSQIVAAIRGGALDNRAQLRLGDWESLGSLCATVDGKQNEWQKFVKQLKLMQSDLLLEDEQIVDALELWLEDEKNYEWKLSSRELYGELADVLGATEKDRKGWYKSPQSFAARLKGVRSDLALRYGLRWELGTSRKNHNRLVYWFERTDNV